MENEKYIVELNDESAADPWSRPGEPQPKTAEQIAEERREAAFDASYSWHGKAFEGFSSSRKDLWRSVCHAAGYTPLSECFDEMSLFHPHAKAAVYVCIQEKSHLRSLKAKGLSALVADMEEWIDKNIPPYEENDSFAIGLKIFNDSHENAANTVPQTIGLGK